MRKFKIKKTGNTQGVSIPKTVLARAWFEVGDEITYQVVENGKEKMIILRKVN